MPRQTRRKAKPRTNKVKCPVCAGNHHVNQCFDNFGMIASALLPHVKECVLCGEVTLGGEYCVDCVFDRAVERIMKNVC